MRASGTALTSKAEELGAEVAGEVREPGNVAAGPRKALGESSADRVAGGAYDDGIVVVAFCAALMAGAPAPR